MPSGHLLINVVPPMVAAGLLSLAGYLAWDAANSNINLAVAAAVAAWFGLGIGSASVAILFELPGLYLKRPDGTLPHWVWFYLGGWLLIYRSIWYGLECTRRPGGPIRRPNDRSYDLIAERIVLGRILDELPQREDFPKVGMVIDCTCEFAEPRPLRSVPRYLLAPTVDTTCSDSTMVAEAAKAAVDFLSDHANKTVYVHCANGYGRSAVMVAAILVMRGDCDTYEDAVQLCKQARPVVRFSKDKMNVLHRIPIPARENIFLPCIS